MSTSRRFRLGRLQFYVEPRNIWVGVYIAPDAIYFCPLPLVVIKVERSLRDWSDFRLIAPPRVGRWHVVGTSPHAGESPTLVGRYRTRWTACFIASRLSRVSQEFDQFMVVRSKGSD